MIPFHPYTEESVEDVTPDRVYEWWVEIRPAAVRIPAGHRLRLSIQPSDTVRFLPTGQRLSDQAGGVLRVHHGVDHPSSVVLPIGG